jgi:hypothetical protein
MDSDIAVFTVFTGLVAIIVLIWFVTTLNRIDKACERMARAAELTALLTAPPLPENKVPITSSWQQVELKLRALLSVH